MCEAAGPVVSIQAIIITDFRDLLHDMSILRLRISRITENIVTRFGQPHDDRCWTKAIDKQNRLGELRLPEGRRCDDRVT
jgi:hypothetical protein